MLDSAILEVIIGMIFIYSLLSILVTQINSIITVVLRLRARHLREGVHRLVHDRVVEAKILTHPLIRLVDAEMVDFRTDLTYTEGERIAKARVNDVTWIEPKTFASVMLGLIRSDANAQLFGKIEGVIGGMPAGATRRRLRLILNKIMTTGEGLEELRQTIQNIPEDIYRETLLDALEEIDEEIGNLRLEPNSVVSVMVGVRYIKNDYLKIALDTIISTSETLEEIETKLVDWFNDGMARSSQAFSNHMQRISIIVGIIIAVLINVDTVNIARTFWEDPALRANVNALVQTVDIQTWEQQLAIAEGRLSALSQEDGVIDEEDLRAVLQELMMASSEASSTLAQFLDLRVPIGWYYEDLSGQEGDIAYALKINDSTNLWNLNPFNNNPNWWSMILAKLVGWGATVIAIAQGAPFWFNLLRRLMGR